MNTELVEIFSKAGLRLTKPRIEVFNVLKESDTPMSIVAIIKACPSIDKVSVYRTISQFEQLNIVSAITHGWKNHYELAAPFKPHHHHLMCTKCGMLTEIHSKKLESLIVELTNDYNFQTTGHHFEITGLCSKCSQNLHIA